MVDVFILGIGLLGFLIVAVLGPLMAAGAYRVFRSQYPSVKASFVLYTVAVEGVALGLLEFFTVLAFFVGPGTSPLPPDVARWLGVANSALIVLVASALVAGLVLDPRHRRGGRA